MATKGFMPTMSCGLSKFNRFARNISLQSVGGNAQQIATRRPSDKLDFQGKRIAFKHLGRLGYQTALYIQQETLSARLRAHALSAAGQVSGSGRRHGNSSDDEKLAAPSEVTADGPLAPDVVYFVEHNPVYTAGRRIKGSVDTEGARLRRETGAEYYEVPRGGQTTYHGPGQLVGYPIIHLQEAQTTVRCYVDSLEKFLIRLCRETYNLNAHTTKDTGVWIDDHRKIAALGVHVTRYVTMHGFALNVDPDMRYYNHIIPCGLVDKKVTSLALECKRPFSMDEVVSPTKKAMEHQWQTAFVPLEECDPSWNSEVERMLQRHE